VDSEFVTVIAPLVNLRAEALQHGVAATTIVPDLNVIKDTGSRSLMSSMGAGLSPPFSAWRRSSPAHATRDRSADTRRSLGWRDGWGGYTPAAVSFPALGSWADAYWRHSIGWATPPAQRTSAGLSLTRREPYYGWTCSRRSPTW